MRLIGLVLMLLALFTSPAVAQGIPIESGGVVLADPWGKGPNGEDLPLFPAATATLGIQLWEDPEALTPNTTLQFLVANTRFEIIGYSERVATQTPEDIVYSNEAKITGGVSLNLLSSDQPTKAGVMYYPNSEWKTAGFFGLDVVQLLPEPIVPGLSLAPQIGSGGLSFTAHYQMEF